MLAWCAVAAAAAPGAGAEPGPAARPARLFLGQPYPLEVCSTFHGALLHWMDSLTGTGPPFGTAGKTTPAHRRAHDRAAGRLSDDDVRVLRDFRDVRVSFADEHRDRRQALTEAFFESATLERALTRSEALLGAERGRVVRRAVERFAPRYRGIWDGGERVTEFLEQSAGDRTRPALSEFLAELARFYGVPPGEGLRPCLVLTPVDPGFGTHAQAVERFLLVEIRPGEDLKDQIGPIVHENAHFLFRSLDAQRVARLGRVAGETGPAGSRAWNVLGEALPTALAQGVATRRLVRGRWSMDVPWYHLADVDVYAKRLFRLARRTLDDGGTFDEDFVRDAVARYPVSRR